MEANPEGVEPEHYVMYKGMSDDGTRIQEVAVREDVRDSRRQTFLISDDNRSPR